MKVYILAEDTFIDIMIENFVVIGVGIRLVIVVVVVVVVADIVVVRFRVALAAPAKPRRRSRFFHGLLFFAGIDCQRGSAR